MVCFSHSFEVDVDQYEEWLKHRDISFRHDAYQFTKTESWACDAIWNDVRITSPTKVCSEPNIANLVAYIVKDLQIAEDIKALGLCTLQMVVRRDHPEDQEFVDHLRSTIEAKQHPVSNEQANAALSSISESGSQFLAMFEEDESDSEVSDNDCQNQAFECVLCRYGPSPEKDMFPCMLCHMNSNAAWSRLELSN